MLFEGAFRIQLSLNETIKLDGIEDTSLVDMEQAFDLRLMFAEDNKFGEREKWTDRIPARL